ncbi:MAG: GTP-binding protein [Promethearchaeota archaeon]|jgi:small GTP-binding protein
MSKVSVLEDLLSNLLNETQDLIAALVVDLDGLIIAKQSVNNFDEEIVGAIMTILEQTISKIRRYAETSFGSGTFDTDEFQLFYIELSRVTPAIFVLVADTYSNMDQFIPYAYIVADKISLILNNHSTPSSLPGLDKNGHLIFNSDSGNNNVRKLAIVGPETVGKSTLVGMYCDGNTRQTYNPTIGISLIKKKLKISKDFNLTLFMLDLGGLKNFARVRRFYYQYSNAVLVLFDYSKPETLDNISEWIEESRQFLKESTSPLILIGNKKDLMENRKDIKEKAQKLANQYEITFFETSALTGEGIDELFTYLISNLF